MKKYKVALSSEERKQLRALIRAGKASAPAQPAGGSPWNTATMAPSSQTRPPSTNRPSAYTSRPLRRTPGSRSTPLTAGRE